jgi:purine-nucleoside phosphorylase
MSQSILAVDMEFSALVTVAAFRGIELAAVLLVSDELYRATWQPGFNRKSFRKKSRQLFTLMTHFLTTLE